MVEKQKENYKVDIGCHEAATLSAFSIEGGNKKNRLNLPVCFFSREYN